MLCEVLTLYFARGNTTYGVGIGNVFGRGRTSVNQIADGLNYPNNDYLEWESGGENNGNKEPWACVPSRNSNRRVCLHPPDEIEYEDFDFTPDKAIKTGNVKAFVGSTTVFNLYMSYNYDDDDGHCLFFWETETGLLSERYIKQCSENIRRLARRVFRSLKNRLLRAGRYIKNSWIGRVLKKKAATIAWYVIRIAYIVGAAAYAFTGGS